VRLITGFARFWWDFVIGDDWRIAAGVGVVLAAGAVVVSQTTLSHALVAVGAAIGVACVAVAAILSAAR
jgi:hypothetical protein